MLRLSDSVAFVHTVPKLVAVFYELRSPLKSLDVSDGEMDFHEGWGTNPRGYAREQVEAAPSSWIDPNPLRPVAPLLAALS
jgi:hypothetical protein